MHPRIILAIARKDAIDILLQKSMLFGLALPLMLTLMYLLISTLITQASQSPTNILVYNPSESGVAQIVIKAIPDAKVTQAESASQVTNAFGSDGTRKSSPYALGLIIPANFEDDLRAGDHPQVNLYLNRDGIGPITNALVPAAINNYARGIANPQSPIDLATAVINPPTAANSGFDFNKYYAALSLLVSFTVGTHFIPTLLIEEKEKKTLRMLMVTPASFEDVILGKLLVVLVYQLILSGVVLAISGGFSGQQVPLILLYALLGACFSLSLGLFFGAIFQTSGTATAVAGIVTTFYIIAGVFAGPWRQSMGDHIVIKIAQFFPTFYLADGVYNAWLNLGSFSSNAFGISVLLGSSLALLVIAAWILRRQAAVAAAI